LNRNKQNTGCWERGQDAAATDENVAIFGSKRSTLRSDEEKRNIASYFHAPVALTAM
jgi:hypothetical protein